MNPSKLSTLPWRDAPRDLIPSPSLEMSSVITSLIYSLLLNLVLPLKCSLSYLSLLEVVSSKLVQVVLLPSTLSNSWKKDISVGTLSVSTSQLLLPLSTLEHKATPLLNFLDVLSTKRCLAT